MTKNVTLQEAMRTLPEQMKKIQHIKLFSKSFSLEEIQKKHAQLDKEYDKIKSNLFKDSFSWYGFDSLSTVDEYKNVVEDKLKKKAFDIELIDYCDYIQGGSKFDEYLKRIDFESEFQDYLKTKGCESSEDLKALNESGFKTVSDLKKAVEKSLNIFDINIASTGMKTDVIKDNIKNIMENATVKELSNYMKTSSNDFYVSQVKAALNLFKDTIDDKDILTDFQDAMEEYLRRMMKLSSTDDKEDALIKELYKIRQKDRNKDLKTEDEENEENEETEDEVEGVVDKREVNKLETNIDTFLKGLMAKESYGAQAKANV